MVELMSGRRDPVAAADGGFPIAEDIPGQADSGPRSFLSLGKLCVADRRIGRTGVANQFMRHSAVQGFKLKRGRMPPSIFREESAVIGIESEAKRPESLW